MSKQSMVWTVGVAAAVFVVGISLSGFVTKADAQEVLPGGRAAKIQSFCASGQGDFPVIQSVPGPNGFIVTDIVLTRRGTGNGYWVRLMQGEIVKADLIDMGGGGDGGGAATKWTFESGIRLEPGEPLVLVHDHTVVHYATVSGYSF